MLYRDWESTLEREGLQLRRWLRDRQVKRILDTSCGQGTQTIALAQLGFQIVAADPNPEMLGKTQSYAKEQGVANKIEFVQADFVELLDRVSGDFDVVLTKGSAFPRLITDDAIAQTLHNFYALLNSEGTVIIGMQDFEPFIEDRPRFFPGRIHDPELNEPQLISFDIWDWNDDVPLTVTINRFLVSGRGLDYQVQKRPVVCRALTAVEVQVALLEAGFKDIEIIRDRLELVMIARK